MAQRYCSRCEPYFKIVSLSHVYNIVGNKDDDEILKTTTRAEWYLQLLLAVLLERHVHGVGDVSEREELRHRVVQLLCAEAMAHSKVMQSLEVVEEEVELVDEELRRVAVLEGAAGKRVYKVKKGENFT